MDNSLIHLRRGEKEGKWEEEGREERARQDRREMDLSANEACVKFNSQ